MIDKFGVDAVGPLVGQMEVVRGITALTGDGFTDFSQKFVEGVNGATAAAQISEFKRVSDAGRQSAQGVAAEGLKSGAGTSGNIALLPMKSLDIQYR